MNKIYIAGLGVLIIFLSLFNLGKWAFNDADEAIYAEVYHESLIRKDFLAFTYQHQPWHEKPPLYFWLMRGGTFFFGENEFSLRLVSSLLTVVSIVFTALIVFELTKNQTAAIFSTLVLLSTAYFWFTGRQVRLDVPVTSAILLSFYSYLKAKQKPIWFLFFGIGVTIGVLFKSVIGLLVYPIIVIHSFTYKNFDWIKSIWFWMGNLLAVAIIASWHIYQTVLFGKNFWDSYLFFHVVGRALTTLTPGPKVSTFYYLWQIVIITQPWFLIFIAFGGWFLLYFSKLKNHKEMVFTFLVAFGILLMFYIPKTRLLYYFTPMYPFMAMFVGISITKINLKFKKAAIFVFVLLSCIGLLNTTLRIFSRNDRGFFLESSSHISRYLVAEDEKKIAEIASRDKLDLYLYNWSFYPTLIYYSNINGGVEIKMYKNGLYFDKPILVLIPTPVFDRVKIAKQYKIVYQGPAGTLVKL